MGADIHTGFSLALRPGATRRRGNDGRKGDYTTTTRELSCGLDHHQSSPVSHELHGESKTHRPHLQEDGSAIG